ARTMCLPVFPAGIEPWWTSVAGGCWLPYGTVRPTPLWHVPDAPPDRAVFAGEALGLWLWAIVWPEQTGLLMYDELVLTDLRDAGAEVDLLPCGALSPRLLS
ncbi:DUF6758 family protein, partial [Streptomyces niveus]|uniref:DUF6758 family protein n=1 Tax=Streptomyces niveus TaxID=193462 RepID=UPI0034258B33